MQDAIILPYMLEADQTRQGVTAATWDTQEEWLLRGIPLWVLDSNGGHEGHQRVHAAEATQEQIVFEAPVDDSEFTAPKPQPILPKLKETAQDAPTWGTAAGKGTPQVARSMQKKKERNRTRRKKQTMRLATRSRKMRIWIKYWRPNSSESGRRPLTLMQVPMMRVWSSQRRKRRLLRVELHNSSHHRVLVVSYPVVSLPPRVGEVQ